MKNDDEFPHLLARIVARPEFPLQWIHAELGTGYFAPLAQSILKSEEIHARSQLEWEFKSIAEFGEEEFICEGSASWLSADKHWQKAAIAEYSNAVCRNLWFHDEGLLFYVQDGDGGFRLASDLDASYAFVLRLIEDDAVGDLRFTAPPRWAKELFLFRANSDAYRVFWHEGSDLTDPLHDTRKRIRREAVAAETRRNAAGRRHLAPSIMDAPDDQAGAYVFPRSSVETLAGKQTNLLAMMNEWLSSDHDSVQRAICSSVLNRPLNDATIPDIFASRSEVPEDAENRCRERVAYMADLLWRRREGRTSLLDEDYCSIAQWIEDEAGLDGSLFHIRFQFTSTSVVDCWREYFAEFEHDLSNAVTQSTYRIHHGVPPYRKTLAGEMELLPRSDPLLQYLAIRGERFDVIPDINLPDWARTLYFKREHLEWHEIVFASLDQEDPVDVERRRQGLWRQIGLESVGGSGSGRSDSIWPWGDHETEYLRHLAAAVEHWWSRYDPDDPTTAPTNDQVSAWLMRECKVSQRLADAMATILRRDDIASGPRTTRRN